MTNWTKLTKLTKLNEWPSEFLLFFVGLEIVGKGMGDFLKGGLNRKQDKFLYKWPRLMISLESFRSVTWVEKTWEYSQYILFFQIFSEQIGMWNLLESKLSLDNITPSLSKYEWKCEVDHPSVIWLVFLKIIYPLLGLLIAKICKKYRKKILCLWTSSRDTAKTIGCCRRNSFEKEKFNYVIVAYYKLQTRTSDPDPWKNRTLNRTPIRIKLPFHLTSFIFLEVFSKIMMKK